MSEHSQPGAPAPILEVRDLVKDFGGVRAVDHCSLDVQPGTITGLIGPNGAGKTTLFNLISGFHKPTSGTITFQGQRIDGMEAHETFHTGLVRTFQIPREFKQMTVLENLMLVPADQSGERVWASWFMPWRIGPQERAIERQALETLEFLNLHHLKDEYAANLSGGQKKLLELGRTLMAKPEDDPARRAKRGRQSRPHRASYGGHTPHARGDRHHHPHHRAQHACGDEPLQPRHRDERGQKAHRGHAGGSAARRGSAQRLPRIHRRGIRMSILTVDNIVAGYGETEILHGVSMHVEAGEAVTLFGPNGCGKSTLMKTIFGLLTPKQGSIVFEDTEITGMPTDRLIRLGMSYVPQTGNIFPSLTIEENLEMGAFVDDSDTRTQITEMYRIFPDLERSRRQRAGSLSGGQRQMLAFARALMLRPRLLLLDEPSAGLSPIMAQLIFDRLRDIRGIGIAILIIEHNIRTALEMSDRGYVLADGQNQLDGSASGLLDNPEIGRLYLGGIRHNQQGA